MAGLKNGGERDVTDQKDHYYRVGSMLQAESFCMFAATMKRKLHIGIWTLNIIIPSHKLTVLYILFFSSSIHALTRKDILSFLHLNKW